MTGCFFQGGWSSAILEKLGLSYSKVARKLLSWIGQSYRLMLKLFDFDAARSGFVVAAKTSALVGSSDRNSSHDYEHSDWTRTLSREVIIKAH